MAVNVNELLHYRARSARSSSKRSWKLRCRLTFRLFYESSSPIRNGRYRALEIALERLSRLDETIERNRAEVREAVRKSGHVWPFPLPPS